MTKLSREETLLVATHQDDLSLKFSPIVEDVLKGIGLASITIGFAINDFRAQGNSARAPLAVIAIDQPAPGRSSSARMYTAEQFKSLVH